MWSPNCFSDSAYSTIEQLASFYDTTSLAPTYPNHFGCNLGPKHLPSTLLVSFVPLVSQAGAACTVYSCWEIYDMPTSVDGPENHLIPKHTALLVHILRRFSDGGLVVACPVLLQMISQPAAQELLNRVFPFFARHITFGILHVITHLAKCCQESFNYLNSKINCCGCRAKSSTVLLLAFQILWKISLWTGILPQADRAQHGFTELTVYWDIVSNKI